MRFSRLADWLSWLETLHPVVIDLGLERVRAIAGRLGVLQPGVPVITVAGTNGKGSVTALLEALLLAHGKRAGLYTSPHILRFNERIRIDGRDIDDASLVRALATVDEARGDISLTYFEFTTLAAFVLFAGAKLDAWVLEIGLGGRLDAVNVIDPDVAVLTSVGMDHMDYLGPTRDDIGREKAGIFRAGKPAVIGEPSPPASVERVIAGQYVPAWRVGADFSAQAVGDAQFDWQGRAADGAPLALAGLPRPALALPNAATALQALYLLPFAPRRPAIEQALRAVRLAGRNQRFDVDGRTLVVDVGHNPHALAFLRAELPRHGVGMRFHIVLGMLADKDIAGAVRELEPLAHSWHIAPLPGPRGATASQLQAAVSAVSGAPVQVGEDVAAALRTALAVDDGLPVLAVGSFFTVAGVLSALPSQQPRD
ncbi:MAG: bifunctional tetrahydrofolate synthase/dihydrofolate synthase [Gammaproteobacteria bacterium]